MGATTFQTWEYEPDVDKAYQKAVDAAYWEYGHGGYTGTIAECSGFVVIKDPGKPLVVQEAFDLADKLIEACDARIDDKWGPAGAIEIVDDHGKRGWLFFGWAST